MRLSPFCFFLFLFPLWSACADRPVYESSHTFPEGVWVWRDTCDFTFTIADTAARYDLALALAYRGGYAHQNLYVRLKTRFPDGRRTTDVQSFDLFDTAGNPVGDCSGDKCEVVFDLKKRVRFPYASDYTLTVEQWMRQDSVRGLDHITLTVKKNRE